MPFCLPHGGEWVDHLEAAQIYFVMSTNETILTAIAERHAAHPTTDPKLLTASRAELVEMFDIEKRAKNKAYAFIMRSGLLDKFYEHCTGEKPQINIFHAN